LLGVEVFMVRSIAIVCCSLALTTAISAQEPKKKGDLPKDRPPAPDVIVNQLLERLDRNKDGKISKEEGAVSVRIKDNFDRIDLNKDGSIDKTELLAMARLLGPPGGPGMRPGLGGPGPGGFRPDPLDFDALDKNADGRLAREEIRGSRFADQFDSIDANKDGKLDPKEWTTFHKKK
jgi:Ca2+-binding EF-hand superfamily protein